MNADWKDEERLKELQELVPSVKEMVEAHNALSPPKEIEPTSRSHEWRIRWWKEFVDERQRRREDLSAVGIDT